MKFSKVQTYLLPTLFLNLNVAWSAPQFPNELPTAASLIQEYRNPITQRLRDLKKNFKIRETDPGKIEMLDSESTPRVKLKLLRSLNSGNTERSEKVTITNINEKTVIEETVYTKGTDLKFTEPSKKIFFEGDSEYTLKLNETQKSTEIKSGSNVVLEVNSFRIGPKTIQTDFYFSHAKIMSVTETLSSDENLRILEYRTFSQQINFVFLNTQIERNYEQSTSLKVEAMRPKGFLLDEFRFYRERTEVYGLDAFLGQFNQYIFTPLFTNSLKRLSEKTLQYLPEVASRKNLALTGRFLDQLLLLSTQIEQAKTNPTLLQTISITINSFIQAMYEGKLKVDDTRPTN